LHSKGLTNLIQIASCLDSQESLTGDPLSFFTETFRAAALRKETGIVYYSDIVEFLRDEYLHNSNQTPHFISQWTGREQFVDDAQRLDSLRRKLHEEEPAVLEPLTTTGTTMTRALATSPLEVLRAAESLVITPDRLASFVDKLFDTLSERLAHHPFDDTFELQIAEHADFTVHGATVYY